MMAVHFILSFYFPVWFFFWQDPDAVFYQSEALSHFELSVLPGEYAILDEEGDEIGILGFTDKSGVLYWYRRVRTPVCLTGECKLIDIGIYWYCTGEFLGLEVYGEHLTKTDHSDFSAKDYERLVEILRNDWSGLREYELSDLVDEVIQDNAYDVDGTSGATKKEIAAEAVEDAVYTTHTIWHLIHVGEKEQLVNLTAGELNHDSKLYSNFLQSKEKDYCLFLLELVSEGKILRRDLKNSLVIEGLKSTGKPQLRSMAIRSLPKCDFTPYFQTELAGVYRDATLEEKLQMLLSFQNIPVIHRDLFDAILDEMEKADNWYVVRVFQVFKNTGNFNQELMEIANQLKNSDNPLVKKTANEFLNGKHRVNPGISARDSHRTGRKTLASYNSYYLSFNTWFSSNFPVSEEGRTGLAAYGMDLHNIQRYVDHNGYVQNEGNVEAHVDGPYPISYRAIIPKKEEVTNLLSPVCVSATHIVFGSIRMEPVFMVLGQSAAIAASLTIDDNVALQDLPHEKLKSELLENKQRLE